MTTPRDDIAGLSKRLRSYEGRNFETTACYNGLRDEAATAIDALLKERDALKAERDKWDRRVAYDELKAREYESRATQQRQIDAITIRAETAAQERDALQARVKELEAERKRYDAEVRSWKIGHDQKLATLRRQTTRLQQERDEAYERAAKEAERECYGSTGRTIAKRIRQLASGPEKGREMTTENKFPTISDLCTGLQRLVDGGLGNLPVQVLIVPDSTMQAIGRVTPGFNPDKPALLIEFEGVDGRIGPTVLSTDRWEGQKNRGTH